MTASNESMQKNSSRSEEAHWSSFRGEVLQLQQSLVEILSDKDNGCSPSTKPVKTSRDDNNNMNSRKGETACYGSQINSKANIASKQMKIEAPVDENDTVLNNYRDFSTKNKLPQSQQLASFEELDDDDNYESISNDSDTGKKYSSTQPHYYQYLELVGMEEVDRSVCSVNNKSNLAAHDNDNRISTNYTNAMSHASQNTNALSIAAQELAEMKLKLALTESERDELEFELMQSR